MTRTAKAFSAWLAPAFGGSARLELRPDLEAVEALSTEREALWEILTVNEKRAAVGYGAVNGGDALGFGGER